MASRLWRAILELDAVNLWEARMLTEEQPIIDFLAEIFGRECSADKEKRLFELITASRNPDFPEIASSNAITVLNAARVSFSGKDLHQIRIPRANLTSSNFDNANLEDSDFSNVKLKDAWLASTNFKNAVMTGVQFGEYPTLLLKDWAHNCCFAPDGRILAVGTTSNIHLYDSVTRVLERSLTGQGGCIAFSLDWQYFASANCDGWDQTIMKNRWSLKLWSVSQGEVYLTLSNETDPILSVAFSPVGQSLAFASRDGSVKLCSIANGELRLTFKEDAGMSNSIAFSLDGRYLASASAQIVTVWSVERGELHLRLKDHNHVVNTVAFSLDGKYLASGSNDQTVNLWVMPLGNLYLKLKGHTETVTSVAFSPNGQWLASGSEDKTIILWSIMHGELHARFIGHAHEVAAVAFSPNGKRLVSTSKDSTLKLWDMDLDVVMPSPNGHTHNVTSLAFSPDNQLLVSGSLDGTVKLWSMTQGELKLSIAVLQAVFSVAYSPNGQYIACAGNPHTVKLLSPKNGAALYTFEDHNGSPTSVAFSPDGQWLASGGADKKVYLRSIGTERFTKVCLEEHDWPIHGVIFSPDSKRLVSGGEDGLRVWSVKSGKLKLSLEEPGGITSVTFSGDGQYIAFGNGVTNTVTIWSVKRKKLLTKFIGNGGITSVAFSPDYHWLASSGKDNTLRLWNIYVKTEDSDVVITNLSSIPNSISFVQNEKGTFLASGHDDHSVRYWQLIQKNNKPYLQLLWSTHKNAFLSQNACIEGVKGLSQDNLDLFIQRGAIGASLQLQITESTSSNNTSKDDLDLSSPSNLQLFSMDAKTGSRNKKELKKGENVDDNNTGNHKKKCLIM